jgi:hypothetical protein
LAEKRLFRVRYDLQVTDSTASAGVGGTPDGKVLEIISDGDVGGRGRVSRELGPRQVLITYGPTFLQTTVGAAK